MPASASVAVKGAPIDVPAGAVALTVRAALAPSAKHRRIIRRRSRSGYRNRDPRDVDSVVGRDRQRVYLIDDQRYAGPRENLACCIIDVERRRVTAFETVGPACRPNRRP